MTKIDFDTMMKTGAGTLAGRYLRRFWQPVLLADDLKPGFAMPLKIMGDEFTLYRGEGGTPHAVAHRCAHRGAQLSVGFVEDDCIRCLYHGWKYDGAGNCVEQPAEHEHSFADKVKIKAYPVQEYLGMIFVYMGEGAVPELPRLPEMEADGVLDAYMYVRECNYFQNIENGVDEAHLPFTHRSSAFDVLNHDVPKVRGEITDYGVVQYGLRSNEAVRLTHFLMPNILTFVHPASDPVVTEWALYMSWRVPIDDAIHKSFVVELFTVAPEERAGFVARRRAGKAKTAELIPTAEIARQILAGKLRLRDVAHRPDIVNLQDHVAQTAQGVFADRDAECLGSSDHAVKLLRQLWMQDLSDLADGREPKRWVYPDRLRRPRGLNEDASAAEAAAIAQMAV